MVSAPSGASVPPGSDRTTEEDRDHGESKRAFVQTDPACKGPGLLTSNLEDKSACHPQSGLCLWRRVVEIIVVRRGRRTAARLFSSPVTDTGGPDGESRIV